jgi:hypothetical protein
MLIKHQASRFIRKCSDFAISDGEINAKYQRDRLEFVLKHCNREINSDHQLRRLLPSRFPSELINHVGRLMGSSLVSWRIAENCLGRDFGKMSRGSWKSGLKKRCQSKTKFSEHTSKIRCNNSRTENRKLRDQRIRRDRCRHCAFDLDSLDRRQVSERIGKELNSKDLFNSDPLRYPAISSKVQ